MNFIILLNFEPNAIMIVTHFYTAHRIEAVGENFGYMNMRFAWKYHEPMNEAQNIVKHFMLVHVYVCARVFLKLFRTF